jgi:hypothetical protein
VTAAAGRITPAIALPLIRARLERLDIALPPTAKFASTEHVRAVLGAVQDLLDVVEQLAAAATP